MSLTTTTGSPKYAWTFDGSTTDYITGLTGTTTGTVSYTPGKFNQAITFPNSSGTGANYVSYTTTPIPIDSGMTIAFWVKFNQVQDSYFCVMGGSSQLYFKTQGGVGGSINWFLVNNGQFLGTSVSNYAVNTWYHLALSIGNTSVGAYLNGVLQSTNSYTVAGTTVDSPTIGAYFGTGMNGLIDDLRIFDRALTSAQVLSIYNQQGMPGRGVADGPQPNVFLGPLLSYPTSTGTPPTNDGTKLTFTRASSQYLE